MGTIAFRWIFRGCAVLVVTVAHFSCVVSQADIPVISVEIGIVCDMEFAEHFKNQNDRIQNYILDEIQDLEVYFSTLRLTRMSFKVLSFVIINSPSEQPFIENARFENGSTNTAKIRDEFGNYSFSNKNFSSLDLVIIFTGSKGTDSWSSLVGIVCHTSSGKKQYESVIVVRAERKVWFSHTRLTIPVATALGAPPDNGTVCQEKNQLMNYDRSNPSSYFFSNCSDIAIQQVVLSSQGDCLRKNRNVPSLTEFEHRKFPLTITERCQLRFNQSGVLIVADDKKSDSCFSSKCYMQNRTSVGQVFPIYNTPCGDKKFCFRGRCLSKGVVIKNTKSQKCLAGTNKFVSNDPVKIFDCPQTPTDRHEEFMLLEKGRNEVYLAVPVYNVDNKEKCLTVDCPANTLLFENCPDYKSSGFGWTLYFLHETLEFVLYHRLSKMYVSVDEMGRLEMKKISAHNDPVSRWEVYGNNSYINTVLKSKLFFGMDSLTYVSVDKNMIAKVHNDCSVLMYVVAGAVSFLIGFFGGVSVAVYMKTKWVAVSLRSQRKNSNKTFEQEFYLGAKEQYDPAVGMISQAELLPFDKKWEFSIDQLIFGKKLGSGAFGCVFQADGFGLDKHQSKITVAVKMVPETADNTSLKVLASELKLLSRLGRHINIVNLLGACTKQISSRKLFVILEFCENGNLRSYLHEQRNKNTDGLGNSMLLWAFQIARGMEYLESKRVLHGDLAARNCLLAKNNVIKICDFGLSKNLQKNYDYNYSKDMKGALLPYKWMAVESIKCGIFSSESDVWSYGVVLWEIFSLGENPYPGYKVDEEFVEKISNGYRLERPSLASSKVYDIMVQCWNEDPNKRPTFSLLVIKLGRLLEEKVFDQYFQLCYEYQHGHEKKQKSDGLQIETVESGECGRKSGSESVGGVYMENLCCAKNDQEQSSEPIVGLACANMQLSQLGGSSIANVQVHGSPYTSEP